MPIGDARRINLNDVPSDRLAGRKRSIRPRGSFGADGFVILDDRNDLRGCDGLLVIAARAFDDGLGSNGVGVEVGEDLDANAACTPPSKYFHGGRHHKPKRITCDIGQTI